MTLEAITKYGIRRLIYTVQPADAGATVEHILRQQMHASAAAIKRAKPVGGDAVPFVEFGFENYYPNTVPVKEFQESQLSAAHDYEWGEGSNVAAGEGVGAGAPFAAPATNLAAPIAGITLDGARCRTNAPVRPGARVTLLIDDLHLGTFAPSILPQPGPITIIHEDDDIIVLNKPPHLTMYPGATHDFGTLTNYLLDYLFKNGQKCNPHPVHRLDKDTTGLVVFAKNSFAHDRLQTQLHTNDFQRMYLAVCCGAFANTQLTGTICAPIKRLTYSPGTFGIHPDGKAATTHYQVIHQLSEGASPNAASSTTAANRNAAQGGATQAAPHPDQQPQPSTTSPSPACAQPTAATQPLTLVQLQLETGRTHQIRIHMSSIGHPLLGDATYGQPSHLINRTALHSWRLTITHPTSGQPLTLTAPIPPDFPALT